MVPNIVELIRDDLKKHSNEAGKLAAQRFFKDEIKSYGIPAKLVHSIVKTAIQQIGNESKALVFEICDELWQSGFIEESIIASDLSFSQRKNLRPGDFEFFQLWVSTYVNNWASCDTFCTKTVGDFLMKYPEFLPRLKQWAISDNRWLRRASAVSLIFPARKGMFIDEVFEIAKLLLEDKDDLVQKGYGWMLKVAAAKHEMIIFDFVMKHKVNMPRTALRYAIEKMPINLKRLAMEK